MVHREFFVASSVHLGGGGADIVGSPRLKILAFQVLHLVLLSDAERGVDNIIHGVPHGCEYVIWKLGFGSFEKVPGT